MRTLDSAAACKVLLVDDQQSVHDAYRTILTSAPPKTDLEEIEDALFGDIGGQSNAEFNPGFGDDLVQRRTNIVSTIDGQFELSHALQGDQAIGMASAAVAAKDPFEMAFVDMRMPPGMDGLETIQRLWEIDPLLQVVLCPAFSDYSWSTVLKRLGFVDNLLLLKKPFSNEEVFQLAMAMTHKRRAISQSELQLERLRQANEQLQTEVRHRMTAETELQHAASHDSLTKLPNRTCLKRVLSHRFENPQVSANASDALIFLDLDNFKVINDSLGHAVGDQLLIQVAERLQNCVAELDRVPVHRGASPRPPNSPSNLVARLGGDEFVIFLVGNKDQDAAIEFAEQIRYKLCLPYTVSEHELTLGTSLGIAFCGEAAPTPEELMRNADLAMYRAKFSGKHCLAVFDHAMHESMSRRLALEESLRTVLKDGGLRLDFQPIFDMVTGDIVGLESLVRWDHATQGLISPADFIPVAEETGLIVPIGRWILEEACRTIHRISGMRRGVKPISVSVNVSKRQIADHDFVELLGDVLQTYEVPAELLNLEITESLIMETPEDITERLTRISNLGVQIHMDDFGTGHSSLSCLHRFPIDVLKIDRSFVATMQPGDDYESIVHAIITLAHNLDTKVIAEGIETPRQLQQLRELDCDCGQGYLYSKPKSIDELEDLLLEVKPTPSCNPAFGFERYERQLENASI
ncbi:putative bifunctional diguanylate cyclase/phosphodiesterase [Novipirellula artificiosorum]|uniref:Cyclic di-GMP phosphodiesterase Gmr n=1 Tax=Novipirellula artificiosorum TaxID=2528016 RepID=A0A5C6DH48_9BACT|nr:EAL domain-containing protein [Novipirellula artificiosorum]TWU36180.1 Cyclic di-GMP phosphodiesterase Gmr [Novipirellula artificiosorum]